MPEPSAPAGREDSPATSARTTWRRWLAVGLLSGPAVFAVVIPVSAAAAALVSHLDRPERYARAAERWDGAVRQGRDASLLDYLSEPRIEAATWLPVLSALAAVGVALGVLVHFRTAPLVMAAVVAAVLVGDFVFVPVTDALFAGALFCTCGVYVVLLDPILRPLGLEGLGFVAGARRIAGHFRRRNVLWLVPSVTALYYLGMMGVYVALDWTADRILRATGLELHVWFDAPRYWLGAEAWSVADLLPPAAVLSALAAYHCLCAGYVLNQIAYLAEAGRSKIVHRVFWWPFVRVDAPPAAPAP